MNRLEEAEAQLQSMRRDTLDEPGCVFMQLVQPQDDADSWVMRAHHRDPVDGVESENVALGVRNCWG